MPIVAMNELKAQLPETGRLLGLDLGSKTIGLALSDLSRTIASPMETILRSKFTKDAGRLTAIIAQQNVIALILGLPVNMNGSEGPRCQSVRQFAENFLQLSDIKLAFWDERLSTQAVTRTMLAADLSRKKRAQTVDKLAASFILQGALDFLKRR